MKNYELLKTIAYEFGSTENSYAVTIVFNFYSPGVWLVEAEEHTGEEPLSFGFTAAIDQPDYELAKMYYNQFLLSK